jgi:hypothetical protein
VSGKERYTSHLVHNDRPMRLSCIEEEAPCRNLLS